jgi:sugar lactone lactonase YvrE
MTYVPRVQRALSIVAADFSFLEAPRWHDGELWFSDFYTHRVHALDRHGQVRTVCVVAGQPSGLGFTPAGQLLVVSMLDRRILRREHDALVEAADLSALAPYHCNDMLVDGQGRAYVGNFGWNTDRSDAVSSTALLLVQAGGRVAVAADDLVFPNGMVSTADGSELIVAETFASRISSFDVTQDGMLRNRRTWAQFAPHAHATIAEAVRSGSVLPDGLALDAEGAIWVGDAAGRGICRVAEGGTVLDVLETNDLAVYAAALGGHDRRTLFMCASPPLPHNPKSEQRSVLLSCRVDVPGAGLP